MTATADFFFFFFWSLSLFISISASLYFTPGSPLPSTRSQTQHGAPFILYCSSEGKQGACIQFFLFLITNLSDSSRWRREKSALQKSRPLRPFSPSLLGFDLCVIDVVNDPISRLTAGAVTITGIEVSSSLFLGSTHFLLLSLHQPRSHLLFVGGEVMPLRQKGASGQLVVWVCHCTKLLGRRRGSRKVDWMAEEEGMVIKKGKGQQREDGGGGGGQDEAGRQKQPSQEAKRSLGCFCLPPLVL